jgi:DNA-binding NarL/FixJ family response regulator
MVYRVLLADDHAIVRDGLKSVLLREGFEIVAEASDGHEAVDLTRKLRPDAIVMDVSMPSLNGIDAAREIHNACPQTKTILLTMYKESQFILEALRAGVKGYVLKAQASADLVRAIRSTLAGDTYLSPGISDSVVQAALTREQPASDSLTQRERQVLQLIAEGKTNKEISQQLAMSVKTVESYRRNLMIKLNIHETAGLVRHAIKIGLIQSLMSPLGIEPLTPNGFSGFFRRDLRSLPDMGASPHNLNFQFLAGALGEAPLPVGGG